jgi:hypothetical protein
VIVGGVLAAADVVAKMLEAEAAHRIDDGVDDRVAPGGAPAADVDWPTSTGCVPALEGLAVDARRRP